MEWIIESYDRRTDRDGENRFTSEGAFMSGAEELYHDSLITTGKPSLGYRST
jgi:hypothetical protein